MAHPTKHLDLEFVAKWREFSKPLKAAIKKELAAGVHPSLAVHRVFKKYKVREKLQQLIMTNILKARQHGFSR
jgi:hypothetical protein